MAVRSVRKRGTTRAKRSSRTAAPVRTAAAAAVERVLGSREAFALMIRRLEDAGWRIEPAPAAADHDDATLTAPERAR